MNKLNRQPLGIRPDIRDQLEVFLYTNLSAIVSNDPVILTPEFKASLTVALNSVGEKHHLSFPRDLMELLDVFVIENANKDI
ncbi:hypothetical protein EV210_107178 [Anaerospora hongkongensis]|uniref:Uncharacterized protein n=1 Tax=Anaerospora hongkongensis TaxID=244830 RepID=A0A4R1Q0R7_9FIRM|nr:hypothetical protein [Anaerospora hongkongensis]TCL36913.1 hypothetical protein EV210_107178 [Anaerospora hongkongensis]